MRAGPITSVRSAAISSLAGRLQAFARVIDRLEDEVADRAIEIARHLIIAIAQHFKKDHAVLAFNSGVCILKDIDESAGPEKVLRRLLALSSYGDTNIIEG